MRLDGSISKIHEREAIIDKFAQNHTYSVFLLTTGVGGVGLTLTAADRVVICKFPGNYVILMYYDFYICFISK